MTICRPDALFLHTGKLGHNPDLEGAPAGVLGGANDLKFNEYVVFDEAQVRIAYIVQFKYSIE